MYIDAQFGVLLDHAWNGTADGCYVDVTGERHTRRFKDGKRMFDHWAYVLCYEIPRQKMMELVRNYHDQWPVWQPTSKIEWFTRHDPERLKKGPTVIRVAKRLQ